MSDSTTGATTPPSRGLALTRREAILLLRYVPAKLLLARLRPYFLLKWALAVVAIVVLLLGWPWQFAALLIVLSFVLYVAQRLASGTIRRLGALRQLHALDREVDHAAQTWWPRLRDELERLQASTRPWGLLKLGAEMAVRKQRGDETILETIDWHAVIPLEQFDRARQALAEAAATTPG